MSNGQELQVQEKRALEKKDEATAPVRTYMPPTDIYEIEDALIVAMEMPGVEKDHLEVSLENDVLSVSGRIDIGKYENLHPVYTEYNVGHFRRTFDVSSSRIDRDRISAEVKDGVLTLRLPKAEASKLRKISIG
jgi:HSP20 family protein